MAYEADGVHVQNIPADYRAIRDYLPSIFMPRWASRITLEVTGVRVERVQDITEKDAKNEGVEAVPVAQPYIPMSGPSNFRKSYREGFGALWETLNAKRGYGWDVNPWVWVVSFRRINA